MATRDLTSRSSQQADQVFRGTLIAAGISVFVVLGAVMVFLAVKAVPALREMGVSFFTESTWFPDGTPPTFGVVALAFGTLLSSFLALLIAAPIAIGAALVAVELAPKSVARWIGYAVDLLAAVPSVVYGLWGMVVLVPLLVPVEKVLNATVGIVPLFANNPQLYGRSLFAASVVLAIMILPIISALSREVFARVPAAQKEAALALGATKWEMIRMAILPFGRSGLIGACMLGLGRAIGETIAVALVLSATFSVNWHIFEPGGNTIAANIATKFGEAGEMGRSALIASGLVLFAITLVVNMLARAIIARTGSTRTGNLRRKLA